MIAGVCASCGGGQPDAGDGGTDAGEPPIDASPRDAGPDGGPPVIGDPLTWDTAAPGPYRVGYRTFLRTYRPAGQDADRTIRIHVWYPTFDTSGPRPTYTGIYRDSSAFTDASLAASPYEDGHYPLHVFSHGHQGFAGVAHFLHRFLATHGWVTVAPDHTGNTLVDNVDPRPTALYYERSLDCAEAIDALDELETGDPLAGLVGTAEVMLTGHSFGTHTAWSSAGATYDVARIEAEWCDTTPCTAAELDVFRAGLRDPRVVVSVPMAGAISSTWFGDTGHGSVTIPIFSMSGGADPVGADAQFDRVAGLDFTWIEVAGACHEFFGLGCAGELEDLQAPIVGRYVLALGRHHVLGDDSAGVVGVLDGTVQVSPLVTLRVRE